MAAWYEELFDDIGGFVTELPGDISDWLSGLEGNDIASIVGAIGGLSGIFDTPQEKVGYQGKIPEYTAVQDRVPLFDADTGRRPGAGGRRYFTDTIYAQKPQSPVPTLEQARQAAAQQAQGLASINLGPEGFAGGGLASLQGRFMRGPTDGMGDQVPAMIEGKQPAAMAHGEFVVPADAVSHLGNGNSEAGANELYAMIERIRKARTGNPKQGKRINPSQYTAA